jgi:hypothetical protein
MSNSLFENKNLRALHRDIGYFFIGLIIAFCVSGILLNHRTQWKPMRYKYDYKQIQTTFRLPKDSVTLDGVKSFNEKNKIADYQGYDFRGDSTLVIFYKGADATISLVNGKAEINMWRQTPVVAQLYFIHMSFRDDNWFKWYSDIFALGLLTIAITGMFLVRGKNSFRKRGWWLALAGLIAPMLAVLLYAGTM